mgnify:CR=1 FL=1|jgi:hypothetical protein
MTSQKKLIGFTILVWCLITAIYAYLYITTVLSYPNLQGYETEWQFQLLMFSIFRLPWLLLALVLIIFGEIKFLKK